MNGERFVGRTTTAIIEAAVMTAGYDLVPRDLAPLVIYDNLLLTDAVAVLVFTAVILAIEHKFPQRNSKDRN